MRAYEYTVQIGGSEFYREIAHISNIDGWMSPGELAFLYCAANSIQHGVIVEIGSWKGRSTVCIARAANVPVYSIDPHTGSSEHQEHGMVNTYPEFLANLEKFGVRDKVTPIVSTSTEVLRTWDKKIGLLLIDGDHEYESVKQDFEWTKHVTDWILMHDVVEREGPAQVLKEAFDSKKFKDFRGVGSLMAFRPR